MNFGSNGFDLGDLEKLVLCLCFVAVVIISCIKYFIVGDISANWTNIVFIIGGLFTARKAISYFKKENYGDINYGLDERYYIHDTEKGDI